MTCPRSMVITLYIPFTLASVVKGQLARSKQFELTSCPGSVDNGSRFGGRWVERFVKRHPELQSRFLRKFDYLASGLSSSAALLRSTRFETTILININYVYLLQYAHKISWSGNVLHPFAPPSSTTLRFSAVPRVDSDRAQSGARPANR